MDTMIRINSGMSFMKNDGKSSGMDYRREIKEIISIAEEAKNRLGRLSVEMETDDLVTDSVDEAMDALDDAIDLLEEAREDL